MQKPKCDNHLFRAPITGGGYSRRLLKEVAGGGRWRVPFGGSYLDSDRFWNVLFGGSMGRILRCASTVVTTYRVAHSSTR